MSSSQAEGFLLPSSFGKQQPMTQSDGVLVNPVISSIKETDVDLSLPFSELAWIGERIYANECASKPENLVYWGKGEEFPSLGIGHFIWYPKGVDGRFIETFPAMVEYVSQFKPAPQWLLALQPFAAPWPNKKLFQDQRHQADIMALQDWLLETQAYQAEFISQQFQQRFHQYLNKTVNNSDEKQLVLNLYDRLRSFKQGRFALLDYVNFKGIGAVSESYQGEQWGLVSVFKQLAKDYPEYQKLSNQALLKALVESAKKRLTLRVELAPKERGEQRWLKGWFKRLEAYLH